MINTKIVEIVSIDSVRQFDVELSINMQQWLDLYVEPDKDDPTTWEDEHKSYCLDETELDHLASKAWTKMQSLQKDVFVCIGKEASGFSYRDMSASVTLHAPNEGISDNDYTASEDLMFLYGALQVLADFMYEVECLDLDTEE